MKTTKITVQFKNGNAVLREIDITPDDADIINEALRYYWINAENIEREMLERGCNRLRNQAFYLKCDLQDVMDKLK
jgi:hypothetical protein